MTAQIGDHVHTVTDPEVDLQIDAIAPQGSGPAWYSTRDQNGHRHYVSAEDAETHGRHRASDRRWPLGRGSTICAVLTDVYVRLPSPWYAVSEAIARGQATGGVR